MNEFWFGVAVALVICLPPLAYFAARELAWYRNMKYLEKQAMKQITATIPPEAMKVIDEAESLVTKKPNVS